MSDNSTFACFQNSNWNSDKEKDTPGVTTWNVDIFVQIVQELVR